MEKTQGGWKVIMIALAAVILPIVVIGLFTDGANKNSGKAATSSPTILFTEMPVAVTVLQTQRPIVPTTVPTIFASSQTVLSLISQTPTETPTITSSISSTNTPNITSTRTITNTIAPSPTKDCLVDVPSLLGKDVFQVEQILGPTILITPNDDYDDHTGGGEYRDYQIGDYLTFISFDKSGIARIFTVLDGLEQEGYSLNQWQEILPRFGVNIGSFPDKQEPAAFYWTNYQGLFIGMAADGTSGFPVWTVKIAQKGYE